MVMLSSLPGKAALVKLVRSVLSAEGWSVAALSHDERLDLDVAKGGLRFFVSCVDADVQLFHSSTKLIEQMTNDASSLRMLANRSLVFILNFNIIGVTLEQLSSRGLVVLHLDERDVLTTLDRFSGMLPSDPDVRQAVILQTHPKLCLAIADQYHQVGDYTSAIRWVRRVLASKFLISSATQKLFELLHQSGETEAAAEVATRALEDRPGDLHFLRIMRDLAQQRGDSTDTEQWLERIDKTAKRSKELAARDDSRALSFEDIMKVCRKNDHEQYTDTAPMQPAITSRKAQAPHGIERLLRLFK